MWARLKNIGKTVFSCAGYILHKTGSAVVFVSSFFRKNNLNNQAAEYAVMALSSSSIFYLSFFTRVPAYWKKITSQPNHRELRPSKIINGVCYVLGTINSLFTAITGFISSTTLFKFIGVNYLPVVYSLGSYVGLSNFITFQTYNLESMKKNSHILVKRICEKDFKKGTLIACVAISVFGISGMGAASYFLTRKFFETYLAELIPDAATTTLASASCITSIATSSLSKGLETYGFFSAKKKCVLTSNFPKLIIPNILFAILYLGSVGLIYQVGFVELLENMGSLLPQLFNELLALPFSLSDFAL